MGFFFRKGFNSGPFRWNFSKSGLGLSFGVKGLRLGLSSSGYSYIYAGRNGLYYQKRKKLGLFKQDKTPDPVRVPDFNCLENKYGFFTRFWLLIVSFIKIAIIIRLSFYLGQDFGFKCFWIGSAYLIYRYFKLKQGVPFRIDYDLDGPEKKIFEERLAALKNLSESDSLWIMIQGNRYKSWKAVNKVNRIPIKFHKINIPGFKTNVPVIGFRFNHIISLAFLPDGIWMLHDEIRKFSYADLIFKIEKIRFTESERVPKDTEIVGQSWRFMREDGSGPDLRHKNNRQYPLCVYGEIYFLFNRGQETLFSIQSSNLNRACRFIDTMDDILARESKHQPRANQEKISIGSLNGFHQITIAILAKLAKANGQISSSEIDFMELIFKNVFKLESSSKKKAIEIFNTSKQSRQSFKGLINEFHDLFSSDPQKCLILLEILKGMVRSDGSVHENEIFLLKYAAQVLGFPDYFDQCFKEQKKTNSESTKQSDTSQTKTDISYYFEILGCSPNSTSKEIKERFHALVKKFHPDIITSLGLHEDFIKFSNERLKQINDAYNKIQQYYGFA